MINKFDRKNWDKEVVNLCDAINNLDGLETFESCCGHGKEPFRIWFKARKPNDMRYLIKAIDERYGGSGRLIKHRTWSEWRTWIVYAHFIDLNERVIFVLESYSIGEKVYQEANQLAKRIIQNQKKLYNR